MIPLNEFALILLKFVEWGSAPVILCFHDEHVASRNLIYNFESLVNFFFLLFSHMLSLYV